MSGQKLPVLNRFRFENLLCLLISSDPNLKLNQLGNFGEMHAKLVIELDNATNQCCISVSKEFGKAEDDGEVTEELQLIMQA